MSNCVVDISSLFLAPYPGMMPAYYPHPQDPHAGYYSNMPFVSSPWGRLPLNRSHSQKITSLSPDSDETNNNEGKFILHFFFIYIYSEKFEILILHAPIIFQV